MNEMQIKRTGEQCVLTASNKDMRRVLTCLLEAAETLSRSEFFIRVGWAQEDVRIAVRQAGSVLRGESSELELQLPDGIEAIENPKRSR
jgi:hypothetical protein